MLAREKAWECLCEICIQKQYSNLYLRKALEDVSEMDKALVSEIVYGTLQTSFVSTLSMGRSGKQESEAENCFVIGYEHLSAVLFGSCTGVCHCQ